MSKRDLINEGFNPLDFIEGVSSDFVLNLALKRIYLEKTINYFFDSYPSVGIIRLVDNVDNVANLLSANQKELRDELIFKNRKNISIYRLLIEVEGITESYEDFFNKKISKDIFYSSLLEIYISNEARIPIKDEMVKISYENETDFLTIKFDGFISDKVILDPNLEKYINNKPSRASNFFPSGA